MSIRYHCERCGELLVGDQEIEHRCPTGSTLRLRAAGQIDGQQVVTTQWHAEVGPFRTQRVCATCGASRDGQAEHVCPGPPRGARQSSFRTASPQCEQPVPPPAAPEHLTEVGRRVRVPK